MRVSPRPDASGEFRFSLAYGFQTACHSVTQIDQNLERVFLAPILDAALQLPFVLAPPFRQSRAQVLPNAGRLPVNGFAQFF